MSNYEIRAKARADLGGNIFDGKWMMALLAALAVSLIIGVCSAIPVAGSIGAFIISGPLMLGLSGYFIQLSRGEEAKIENVFDSFSDHFVQSLLLYLMTTIFTFLWSLLFVIPGIVKAYAYSMAFYIKRDNPTYDWKQCLDESQRIMNGNKWNLFCLQFSFIGWEIVCILTGGIGYLWLAPYMSAANANFYESIK
jgi:uncharacterized membrane protein